MAIYLFVGAVVLVLLVVEVHVWNVDRGNKVTMKKLDDMEKALRKPRTLNVRFKP